MSDRFKPTRAGVINVWDYVDEEWVFADGRLALRGHNGSGKTKALEVLFPFVLDGVADSRRLDPFSGENRTMKSNLLYRGQESEYGYVWMEFARSAEAAEPETVTLIIGMRAHRNTDGVRMSFFVTGRRLGADGEIMIPHYIKELSSRRVLTMTYIDGYPLADVMGPAVDAELREWVANKAREASFVHLWSEAIAWSGYDFWICPPPGSYLHEAFVRVGALDRFRRVATEDEVLRLMAKPIADSKRPARTGAIAPD